MVTGRTAVGVSVAVLLGVIGFELWSRSAAPPEPPPSDVAPEPELAAESRPESAPIAAPQPTVSTQTPPTWRETRIAATLDELEGELRGLTQRVHDLYVLHEAARKRVSLLSSADVRTQSGVSSFAVARAHFRGVTADIGCEMELDRVGALVAQARPLFLTGAPAETFRRRVAEPFARANVQVSREHDPDELGAASWDADVVERAAERALHWRYAAWEWIDGQAEHPECPAPTVAELSGPHEQIRTFLLAAPERARAMEDEAARTRFERLVVPHVREVLAALDRFWEVGRRAAMRLEVGGEDDPFCPWVRARAEREE